MTESRGTAIFGSPFLALCIAFSLAACATVKPADAPAEIKPVVIQTKPPGEKETAAAPESDSLTARIRREVELGSPSSLQNALNMIRAEKIESLEFGRGMIYVIVKITNALYPDLKYSLPPTDPPLLSAYYRIFQEAEKNTYRSPARSRTDFLEYVLPSFVLLGNPGPEVPALAEADLLLAEGQMKTSALVPYFLGLICEKRKDLEKAFSYYQAASLAAPDCYPADLGRVRTLISLEKPDSALEILVGLREKFPEHIGVKKSLALAYYEKGSYTEASPLIVSVLQSEPTNIRFLLMRAHLLVLAKNYQQAIPLLDAFAIVNPEDRLYILLRARVAWEGDGNREEALKYLAAGLALFPEDQDLSILAARIRMQGSGSDKALGKELLFTVLKADPNNIEALKFLVNDALASLDYKAASEYLSRLLAADSEFSDYALAIRTYQGAMDQDSAFAWIEKWFAALPESEDAASAYAQMLISAKKEQAAAELIAKLLGEKGSPKFRSRLWAMRSRLEKTDDAAMNDLRASLLENPENLDALIGMFDLYFKQKDFRKAQYYLKQALAAGPEDPEVLRRSTAYSEATEPGGQTQGAVQ